MDEGERRRDEGMGRVKSANAELLVKILVLIRELPTSWVGLTEDIRTMSEARFGLPTHHNFYGTVAREAVKLEILEYTGKVVKMKRPKAHAHRTRELKRT